MNVKQSIKMLRMSHHLTQAQFGHIAGVSAMAVSQWECGRAVPRMGAIQRLADFFDIPKSVIMGDIDEDCEFRQLEREEQELVDIMRSITTQGQQQLLVFARGIASTYPKNNQLREIEATA